MLAPDRHEMVLLPQTRAGKQQAGMQQAGQQQAGMQPCNEGPRPPSSLTLLPLRCTKQGADEGGAEGWEGVAQPKSQSEAPGFQLISSLFRETEMGK